MEEQTKSKKFLEGIIFSSKWILIPFYIGLFPVMGIYLFVYIKDIFHIISNVGILSKNGALLGALEAVDIVMVANLIKMIITGSYNSFVSKSHAFDGEKASSSLLKVKMATSIVGVSSIHLLQTFINAEGSSWDTIWKQSAIHGAFLIGALILSLIDYLHSKAESFEHEENNNSDSTSSSVH